MRTLIRIGLVYRTNRKIQQSTFYSYLLIFYRKYALTFHANCLQSLETICMKCQRQYFCGRYLKMSSAECLPSMLSVNWKGILFLFQRRATFYFMTMVYPCILMSFVAALVFLLPAESGEKVSLTITLLLSLAVYMLIIAELLPPASNNFPIIGK